MEVKPLRQGSVPAGYKQTEVGVIPLDWEVKALHLLADRIMVGIASAATHAYRDRGIVMFRNQNIKPGYLDDSDLLYITEDYEKTFKNKRLKAGDLLTARTGYPGTTSIVPTQYEGAQSFTTLITRPRRDVVDSRYLCVFINSEAGQTYFEQNQIGGGQKNVNAGSLKNLLVAFPPTKTEQESIAEALSNADALIESLEELLAKKRQLKGGAMQELLTGKKRLPGFKVKPGYRQTEAGVIPEDWDAPELGQILKATHLGGNYKNSERETSWPLIKMGNLDRGTIKLGKLEFIDSSQPPSSTDKLRTDDVLFNTRNTLDLVGKVALWRDELPEAYFNSNIMRMEFDEARVSSKRFINYILNTSRFLKSLRSIAIGTTSVAAIYGRDLVKLKVPLPTKAEQEAIAAILSDMDAEIAALEVKLTKARLLKQGMMQELLTGRIRLI